MPLLSVIVPTYNEEKTIREILEKINSVDIDKEIIVVDDGSCDATDKILRDISYSNLRVIHHTSNRGKGAAFITGLTHATAEYVIIQDADLEYEPADYLKLIGVIKEKNADMVLGARFQDGYHGLFLHRIGNRVLTGLINLLFKSRLNDYASCYKLSRRETLNKMNLKAAGFDIDAEIICNALKKKFKICQAQISYRPRSYSAGKKIRFKDGLWAIFCILKYRFTD